VTTVLFYDILVTFSDEVEFLWQAKITPASCLFFFIRYVPCTFCIMVNVAYFYPQFTTHVCDKWAVVQLVQAGMVIFVAQTFMALRVYAMSGRNKRLIYGLSIANVLQGLYGIVLMALPGNKGIPVPDIHMDAYHICNLYPANQSADMAFLSLSLAYDSFVFMATLVFTFRTLRSNQPSHLLQVLLRDGVVYFFYIFCANLLWVLCIKYTRPGLKSLQASPNLILTPVMISRLTFSLHEAYRKDLGRRDAHTPQTLAGDVVSDDSYGLTVFSTMYLPSQPG